MAGGSDHSRKLVCPSCGHQTAYGPRAAPRFLVFRGPPGQREAVVVYRVGCAGCGREQDVRAGQA